MLALVPESLDDLLTTNEAAAACGVECSTIRQWVTRGHLTKTQDDLRDGRVVPVYKLIDVLRASRDTRRRAAGGRRTA